MKDSAFFFSLSPCGRKHDEFLRWCSSVWRGYIHTRGAEMHSLDMSSNHWKHMTSARVYEYTGAVHCYLLLMRPLSPLTNILVIHDQYMRPSAITTTTDGPQLLLLLDQESHILLLPACVNTLSNAVAVKPLKRPSIGTFFPTIQLRSFVWVLLGVGNNPSVLLGCLRRKSCTWWWPVLMMKRLYKWVAMNCQDMLPSVARKWKHERAYSRLPAHPSPWGLDVRLHVCYSMVCAWRRVVPALRCLTLLSGFGLSMRFSSFMLPACSVAFVLLVWTCSRKQRQTGHYFSNASNSDSYNRSRWYLGSCVAQWWSPAAATSIERPTTTKNTIRKFW